MTTDGLLGWALAVVPEFWNSLSDKEKSNVETWLGNSINEKKSALNNTPMIHWLIVPQYAQH